MRPRDVSGFVLTWVPGARLERVHAVGVHHDPVVAENSSRRDIVRARSEPCSKADAGIRQVGSFFGAKPNRETRREKFRGAVRSV